MIKLELNMINFWKKTLYYIFNIEMKFLKNSNLSDRDFLLLLYMVFYIFSMLN